MGNVRSQVRIVVIAAVAMAVMFLMGGCSSGTGGVAARFTGHEITESQVEEYTQNFRNTGDLTDDAQWQAYLESAGLTVTTWREQAIRTLADQALVSDKAAELGLTADAAQVEERIAQAQRAAGIDPGDDAAWDAHLQKLGQTPESYREQCEFNVLEQQVFVKELDFTDKAQDELCDEYIHKNLGDQVLRRYVAIEYPLDAAAEAEECLAELRGLEGDGLVKRFAELAKETQKQSTSTLADGDIGWDFMYDEQTIDPDTKLRSALLKPGELYAHVLKGSDAYRVVMCAERVEVTGDVTFASLQSDSFKECIEGLVKTTLWAEQCNEYLAKLEQEANIQVSAMPSGLSYDVEGGQEAAEGND